MEDFLPRRVHANRRSEWLSGARIARISGMGAARDDEAQAVPATEPMGSWPALDRYPPYAIRAGVVLGLGGPQPQIAVEHLKRLARGTHVAKAGVKIGMLAVGADVEVDPDGSYDVEIRRKRRSCE